MITPTLTMTTNNDYVEPLPQGIETFLSAQIRQYFSAHEGQLPAPGLYQRLLEQLERPLIAQTLQATAGNQIRAAEVLGINRNTLRKKMRTLGIHGRPRRERLAAAA